MADSQRNNSALDSLEQNLYDPNKKMAEITIHKMRDKKAKDLPTSWGDDNGVIMEIHKERGISFGAKALFFSFFFLFVSLSFVSWRVLSARNVVSSANIDMTSEILPYIEGGEATPLVITLHNRNTAQLQEAKFTLMYKHGSGSQDEQEKVQEKQDVGTINAGDYKRQDFKVTLYGSEAESRDITVKLEYKVSGSNAIFSKVLTTPVILKTPPISVHIDGPELLSVGQDGTFKISLKNNTGTTSVPSLLQLTLPTTFTIDSSDPKPSSRGSVWNIPSMRAGETKTVTIVGSLSGAQGEITTMRALIGSQSGSVSSVGIVYASQTFDIHLRSSPLSFGMSLGTERGVSDTIRYGDKTTLDITYANKGDNTLQDVKIKLTIGGDAALLKQVSGDSGYYDSSAQTIVWDASSVPELAKILPHKEGSLRAIIPIVSQGVNSPSLKINIEGKSTITETDDVVASISKTWIVQGTASISAKTTYKNSPFPNTGPIPPEPNTDTTYTAHIVVSAQNSLNNARVSFVLPSYVTWKSITSDSSTISYDQKTRTVAWAIGTLGAGSTVNADINLSVKPSQSQVNQAPPITSGIVFDADEEISRAHIRTTISALTTNLAGETWSVNPSNVIDK